MPPALRESLSESPPRPARPSRLMPSPAGPDKSTSQRRRREVLESPERDEDDGDRPPVSSLPPHNKRSRLLSGLHPSQDIIGGMSQGWDMPRTASVATSRRRTRARSSTAQRQLNPKYDSKHHPMDVVIRPKQVAKRHKSLVESIAINTDDESEDDEEDEGDVSKSRKNRRKGSASSFEGVAVNDKSKGRSKSVQRSKRTSTSNPKYTDNVNPLDDLLDLDELNQDEAEGTETSSRTLTVAEIVKKLDAVIKDVEYLKPVRKTLKEQLKMRKKTPTIQIHQDSDQDQETALESRPHFHLLTLLQDFAKENDATRNVQIEQNESEDEDMEDARPNTRSTNTIFPAGSHDMEDGLHVDQVFTDLFTNDDEEPQSRTTLPARFTAINSSSDGATPAQSDSMALPRPRFGSRERPARVVPETQPEVVSTHEITPPHTGLEEQLRPLLQESIVRDTHLTPSQSEQMDQDSQYAHSNSLYWDEDEGDLDSDISSLSSTKRNQNAIRDRSCSL